MDRIEQIKKMIEDGTYDWESAIDDTADKISNIVEKTKGKAE